MPFQMMVITYPSFFFVDWMYIYIYIYLYTYKSSSSLKLVESKVLLMCPNLDETAFQHSPNFDLALSDLSFYVYSKSNLQPSLLLATCSYIYIYIYYIYIHIHMYIYILLGCTSLKECKYVPITYVRVMWNIQFNKYACALNFNWVSLAHFVAKDLTIGRNSLFINLLDFNLFYTRSQFNPSIAAKTHIQYETYPPPYFFLSVCQLTLCAFNLYSRLLLWLSDVHV